MINHDQKAKRQYLSINACVNGTNVRDIGYYLKAIVGVHLP